MHYYSCMTKTQLICWLYLVTVMYLNVNCLTDQVNILKYQIKGKSEYVSVYVLNATKIKLTVQHNELGAGYLL